MPEVRTHLAYELCLDVAGFDASRFDAVLRRLVEQGVSFATLAAEQQHVSDALDRIYALHNECRRRQPPVEMRQIPIPRDFWVSSFVTGSEALPDAYFVAVDDARYIGVSVVHRTEDEPDVLTAGFTGVLPAHAGRGVGLGLKLETIVYARAHGYRQIRTAVLAENVPMVRINEAVGFRRISEDLKRYTY